MSYHDRVLLRIQEHFIKNVHHYKPNTQELKELGDKPQGEKKDD